VRISVVIVTVGTSRVLERGLAAVVRGTRRPHELVLVDQAPEPSTTAVAEHIPVRIHRAPALGVSRARNLGASLATGDYLAFTDDDCVPDDGWLAALADALEGAGAAAASGRVLPLDEGTSGLVAVSSRTDERFRTVGGNDVAPWTVGTGGNLLIRADLFRALGGFDEQLGPGAPFRAAEDIDLVERLLAGGGRLAYTPAAVVRHEMKTPVQRRARRYSYGYGMGAMVARAARRRKGFLTRRYALLQLAILASALRSAAPRRALEPLLTSLGFVSGFVAASRARQVSSPAAQMPKKGVKTR
jgi:O-antigen biosynthesis protein